MAKQAKETKGVKKGRPAKAGVDAEALCRRCGLCCHEKVRFGELVIITDIPCDYLDLETNLCTVYERRLEKQHRCATAEDSRKAYALPGDCPYVGGDANYLAPQYLADHPEYEDAVNALFPGRKEGRLRNVRRRKKGV